jgi:hypothetical protein
MDKDEPKENWVTNVEKRRETRSKMRKEAACWQSSQMQVMRGNKLLALVNWYSNML